MFDFHNLFEYQNFSSPMGENLKPFAVTIFTVPMLSCSQLVQCSKFRAKDGNTKYE